MNVKRFSEYKMINNPEIAGLYRKSFQFYSEKKLLIISFFYAMFATTFCSIFLIKYHIEYVFSLPFLF
jgi:hypothetical protein